MFTDCDANERSDGALLTRGGALPRCGLCPRDANLNQVRVRHNARTLRGECASEQPSDVRFFRGVFGQRAERRPKSRCRAMRIASGLIGSPNTAWWSVAVTASIHLPVQRWM